MDQTGGVIMVTGGSRGIGAATCLLAAQGGYAVGVNYQRDSSAAVAVVSRITARGGQAIALQGDVRVELEVQQMFGTLQAAFGPLTALVNNAGILERQARVEEMDMERVRRVFETNVMGSFLCAREAIQRMSTRHGGLGGSIVNVSSRAAVLGSPGEYVDYAMSKGAIDTLTVGLAKEVAAEGIRVNAVRPGIIETEIHASGGDPERASRLGPGVPLGRAGTAEEIAQAILWLLSGTSSYVTGLCLDVAGGR
ncbi:SDR family oxidoreductase [Deinococcus sp. HMF7620]|uniref:SDR family oxidoreductase n=1 Tax=Deinococcus arboris TaxID=2682977 RepID=A0A7C9LT36_9DEIO|nr:SDR family oxidoreductase [Deinococcus arboris]MVN88721.1 SDR family oxidoreductase [Deinococcus arboris]